MTFHSYPIRSNSVRDNLVSETSAASPTMSEGDSLDVVNKKLEAMLQQMELDRLKLYDKIDMLAGSIRDIDNQQCTHNFTITHSHAYSNATSSRPPTLTAIPSSMSAFRQQRACSLVLAGLRMDSKHQWEGCTTAPIWRAPQRIVP